MVGEREIRIDGELGRGRHTGARCEGRMDEGVKGADTVFCLIVLLLAVSFVPDQSQSIPGDV